MVSDDAQPLPIRCSLGWEVWRVGEREPAASFTYWDRADSYGRKKFGEGNYQVKASKAKLIGDLRKELERATALLLASYVAVRRKGWEEGKTENEVMDEVLSFLWNQGFDVIFMNDGTLHPKVREALGLSKETKSK